jgi:toxin HigB-1
MIGSFKDDRAKSISDGYSVAGLPPDIQQTARRKLRQLEAAERLSDLAVPPGNRLERLRGDREGAYSIRINDQWRICFRWEENGPEDVEIVDYH